MPMGIPAELSKTLHQMMHVSTAPFFYLYETLRYFFFLVFFSVPVIYHGAQKPTKG